MSSKKRRKERAMRLALRAYGQLLRDPDNRALRVAVNALAARFGALAVRRAYHGGSIVILERGGIVFRRLL